MKLGIGTYCYMWSIGFDDARPEHPMNAIGLLQKARELGVSLVQVGPNLPLDKLAEAELDTFVQQARAGSIGLELATRGLETNQLSRQVALARHVGSTLLRTIPEVGGAKAGPAVTADYVAAILPQLQSAGVKLGLENGNMPAKNLRWVVEKIASPYVGIVLDTANSLAVPEGWKHVTRTLAPYTNCLHVKDFVVQRVWSMMGFTVEGRPAGQGQLDIPWLLETVQSAASQFNVVLELWPPEQKTLQETIDLEQAWAMQSVRHLRSLIPD
jgi:sugar phosphate isomerase/epimerase